MRPQSALLSLALTVLLSYSTTSHAVAVFGSGLLEFSISGAAHSVELDTFHYYRTSSAARTQTAVAEDRDSSPTGPIFSEADLSPTASALGDAEFGRLTTFSVVSGPDPLCCSSSAFSEVFLLPIRFDSTGTLTVTVDVSLSLTRTDSTGVGDIRAVAGLTGFDTVRETLEFMTGSNSATRRGTFAEFNLFGEQGDLVSFSAALNQFTASSEAQAVPAPTGLALISMLGFAFLARGRRRNARSLARTPEAG